MDLHAATRAALVRATLGLALAALLAGCGGSHARATAGVPERSCPETVLEALGRVLKRVYREGVASERTVTARRLVESSLALRNAVERKDAATTTALARAFVAQGHMTNLLVSAGGRTLADVGGGAVAPLRGTIRAANGAAIASYATSVWSDEGILAESEGISQGRVALRVRGRSVGGSLALPPGRLPHEGRLQYRHVPYQYTSFGANRFPSGAMRIYLLKPVASTRRFCGATSEDTLVNTLRDIALRIYAAEGGRRTVSQIRRVQADPALLAAVTQRDARAATTAITRLLTEHLVRLRVRAGERLLADVGGPYVLAPVSAPLRVGGRDIGSFVLSIQDDEGYLRLTRRLVGLSVLMYAGGVLVKNSLGPDPGAVPASGSYTYRGRRFRVFTVHAKTFLSGPLTIRVLVPIPYS